MPIENPWRHFTTEETDFVLEMDREAVRAYKDGLERRSREDRKKYTLHTELLPTPFIGDPEAPIVLLSANPGFKLSDREDYRDQDFRTAAIENLTHKRRGRAFFPIDPALSVTSRWWQLRLRWLILETDIDTVASGLFCVQAVPYHSKEFLGGHRFRSQHYTEDLLLKAVERGALVIGMRAGPRPYWEKILRDANPESMFWLRYPESSRLAGKHPRWPNINEEYLGSERYEKVVSALRQE